MRSPRVLIREFRAAGYLWTTLLYVLDAASTVLAAVLAYYVRFEGVVPAIFARWMPLVAIVSTLIYMGLFAFFGLYRLLLRYVSVDTMVRLAAAVALGFAALVLADFLVPGSSDMRPVPFGVLFIQALLVLFASAGARVAARISLAIRGKRAHGRNALIVGAGNAGSLLLREIQGRPDLGLEAIGFLDDDLRLRGRTIGGVPIIGSTDDLAAIAAAREVDELLVAMPSAPPEKLREVLNAAADIGLATRIMPQLVIAKGSVSLRDLRSVEVEDLLGREQTPIDVEQVRGTITGKVVAITGAAGSIGSELCRQVMALAPARLLLLEVDETRLYELMLELSRIDAAIPVMCVCDVRDAECLDAIFAAERPNVVLHAAAYKHVPLMESAPAEAVKTNVLGTLRVLEACERHGAERFVLISTDKAVAPANIMGLTKKLAERVMLAASRRGQVLAVAVRFGNVLASRGSVVPIFETQLRHGGPLTVTDPEVTRYFMTIPEASRLVLQAQAIGHTGDIFVLEMGDPVRIVDLARKMIALSGVPADIEFVGLRPGEKLHESLVHEHEALESTTAEKVLRVTGAAEAGAEMELEPLVEAALACDIAEVTRLIGELDPEFANRGSRA